jgi:hypothetical protein
LFSFKTILEKLLKTEADLLAAQAQVEELNEELEVTLEAEDIIRELSNKNMALEEVIKSLIFFKKKYIFLRKKRKDLLFLLLHSSF